MGSISASIQLYDKMSAPLQNIMGALNMTIASMYDMQDAMSTGMDTSSLDAARDSINQADAAMRQLAEDTANNAPNINENRNAQDNFNRSLQSGKNSADDLMNAVKGVVGAYLTIESVKGVLNASDELVTTTARLDIMNDGLQTTDELVKMVYASAQNARGEFGAMTDVVARFGNNAGDAFGSTEEVVKFANLVQKQMTIAGASTAEASNAMLQLSQALGSGVLRGDELNSIFEQAPNLIQSIATYLDVPIGKIREMAQEGQLSADVVKAAIFASADDINSKFDQMPMTWDQVMTSMKNSALMAFQPVLDKINELANNDQFMVFVENATGMMATLATYILSFFETMGSIATFVSENWSVIAPLVYGVVAALAAYLVIATIINTINAVMAAIEGVKAAAQMMATGTTLAETAAQYGLNAALAACPITWIIAAIIALIAVIFAVCQQIANMTGVANSGFGVICGGVNVVIQFFKNLGLEVANIALGIAGAISALASNIVTAFSNAIANVQTFFYNLLSTAMSVIASIANALNKLPFVEIDVSGITAAADSYAAKAQAAQDSKGEYKNIGDAFKNSASKFNTFQDGWASNAFKSGASWGDGVADKVSNGIKNFGKGNGNIPGASQYDFSNMSDYAGQTVANTGKAADAASKAADSVDISNENLKYLRDIAEQEAVNRFTTAEITVNQTNNNNVSGTTDIDGMVSNLTAGVNEALNIAAEGVHK
jgi:tape measure domain-containing protein